MTIFVEARYMCEGCGLVFELDLEAIQTDLGECARLVPPPDWEHLQLQDGKPPHDYCPECKAKRRARLSLPNKLKGDRLYGRGG
jgi:rubredoxin